MIEPPPVHPVAAALRLQAPHASCRTYAWLVHYMRVRAMPIQPSVSCASVAGPAVGFIGVGLHVLATTLPSPVWRDNIGHAAAARGVSFMLIRLGRPAGLGLVTVDLVLIVGAVMTSHAELMFFLSASTGLWLVDGSVKEEPVSIHLGSHGAARRDQPPFRTLEEATQGLSLASASLLRALHVRQVLV